MYNGYTILTPHLREWEGKGRGKGGGGDDMRDERADSLERYASDEPC